MLDFGIKENAVHSSAQRPYTLYECSIPDKFDYVPMHWHEEFEISFIYEGSADFICGDEKFISHTGDIIVTQPNITHSIYPHNSEKQLYDTVVFHPDILGQPAEDRYVQNCVTPLVTGELRLPVHITKEHPRYEELAPIIRSIITCARKNTPRDDMLLRSELIRFIWVLETFLTTDSVSEPSPVSTGSKENEMIKVALLYMQNHFQESLTINQLAHMTHLSQSYFMSLYKKTVGLSAIEYLLHCRINYACKQLLSTSHKISEIAYDSGFSNLSNFNRQFIRLIGCTPMEYRKRR